MCIDYAVTFVPVHCDRLYITYLLLSSFHSSFIVSSDIDIHILDRDSNECRKIKQRKTISGVVARKTWCCVSRCYGYLCSFECVLAVVGSLDRVHVLYYMYYYIFVSVVKSES